MIAELPVDPQLRFQEKDDQLHAPGPTPDWTETSWWSFHVAERALAGWLYAQLRPNLGTCAGGAFVYDARSHVAWELPYYGWFSHQTLPDPLDLRDVTFKSGVSVRMLEPGMRYRLGYRFRDQTDFAADLEFRGITAPVPHLTGAPPFTGSSHYDQAGRVTGKLWLRGEEIAVDCVSVRDRSWGRRPELIGRRGRLSYAFGSASSDDAFLAFCVAPKDDPFADEEQLASGYLFRDGALRRLVKATRRVIRDPRHGGVSRIEIEGSDSDGRSLQVAGEALSRMFLNGHSLCINTFLRWNIDGRVGWGEDQDVWPVASFADRRRAR